MAQSPQARGDSGVWEWAVFSVARPLNPFRDFPSEQDAREWLDQQHMASGGRRDSLIIAYKWHSPWMFELPPLTNRRV